LDRPKQLLTFGGKTLLQYSLGTASASGAEPIVVVLGANAETLRSEIEEDKAHVVVNTEWQEGMASSIRCGIKAVLENSPDNEGIILMVCDQPFVTPDLLDELIAAYRRTGKQIVACGYDDTFGPPVFFHRALFDQLIGLTGDIGARSIVRQHTEMLEVIPFPEGTFDVDTEADYERIKSKGNQ
jgi:molybdenum cofactor cytidylyltransferase